MNKVLLRLDGLDKKVESLNKKLEEQSEILDKHTVLLDKIVEKIFPRQYSIDLFPINSLEELEDIDNKIERIPKEQLVIFLTIIQQSEYHINIYIYFRFPISVN